VKTFRRYVKIILNEVGAEIGTFGNEKDKEEEYL